MLWHASITVQQAAPRGATVTTCAGRSRPLTLSMMNPEYHRWRG